MSNGREPWEVSFWVIAAGSCLSVFVLALLQARPSVESYELLPEARFARNNLAQLMVAIQAYHDEHGALPYHPAGPEYALYQLKGYMDVSCIARSC